jgi:D-alanyl-D-alanine carboxypeptidase
LWGSQIIKARINDNIRLNTTIIHPKNIEKKYELGNSSDDDSNTHEFQPNSGQYQNETRESELTRNAQILEKAEQQLTNSGSNNIANSECSYSNKKPTELSGDSLNVIVDKCHYLPSDYEPTDLVEVEQTGIRVTKAGKLIRSIVVPDMKNMVSAMRQAGIDIVATSCYRSYATQATTYNYWVAYNGGNVAMADTISARPGHSEHQLGTTCDFSTNEINDKLTKDFENTQAGKWLAQHAHEYGFRMSYPDGKEAETGYSYEPWHWRYIGK